MNFFKTLKLKILYYYFKICRGPDRTSKRAASGPRAVVCSSLAYTMLLLLLLLLMVVVILEQ